MGRQTTNAETSKSNPALKTYMGAGHGGDSGRFGRLKETAMEYAFAVDTLRATPAKRVRNLLRSMHGEAEIVASEM